MEPFCIPQVSTTTHPGGSKENHFTFQGTFKSFIYLIKNPGTMMDKTGRQSEEKPTGESASFFWKESKVSFENNYPFLVCLCRSCRGISIKTVS